MLNMCEIYCGTCKTLTELLDSYRSFEVVRLASWKYTEYFESFLKLQISFVESLLNLREIRQIGLKYTELLKQSLSFPKGF